MQKEKKEHPAEKSELHPRNKHRQRYDFKQLIAVCPELAPFVKLNDFGDESVDFFDPEAVKTLNKALLKQYYNIQNWDIPQNYLCPPIPGRADYIHHIADLLASINKNKIPTGNNVCVVDIGVGANCVYPIIGNKEYGWAFVGSDIDWAAIDSAKQIVKENPALTGQVEIFKQYNAKEVFRGILRTDESIDLTICNPPFHSSFEEAQAGTMRKLKNLKGKTVKKAVLNFGGQTNELWCEGGEARFLKDMIWESRRFADCCLWFSALVSKEANLKGLYNVLQKVEAKEVRTIAMSQGNKTSRILAWTFYTKKEQQEWAEERWGD